MATPSDQPHKLPARGFPAALLSALAVAAALALAAGLAWRPLSSFDIGYHLAYGQKFLDTGHIVQTNEFIYTRLNPSDTGGVGPGCWYDQQGTYHFVNANWLSQALMAGVHRLGGFDGLGVLQFVTSMGIFALLLVTMRRARLPWGICAGGILLIAVTSYERLNLRPELFGYLVLAGQLALLASRAPGRWAIAGLAALQVLAVNFHSYFLLGIALTGAFLADGLLRLAWARLKRRPVEADISRRSRMLGWALGAVLLASLANPWNWRGAIMPIQTVAFMRHNHIGGKGVLMPQPGESLRADTTWGRQDGQAVSTRPALVKVHPWGTIGEFITPFLPDLWNTKATYGFLAVLGLSGLGLLAALIRRRWDLALVLLGFGVVSLQMRRNIAPGSMVLVPVALASIALAWRALPDRFAALAKRAGRPVLAIIAGAVVLLGGYLALLTVQNRFGFDDRQPWRFGFGLSKSELPLEAADIIRTHQPGGRIFCDYTVSSNLMYFTGYEMPTLTNTWAYPPYVMQWVIQACAGQRAFDPIVRDYDISTVVLLNSPANTPLLKKLVRSDQWAVVNVSGNYVTFFRRTGPTAQLAASLGIDQKNFDVDAYVARLAQSDPVPAWAIHNAASLLWRMGWGDAAVRAWKKCLQLKPDYYDAMCSLADALALRGTAKLATMQQLLQQNQLDQAEQLYASALADWDEAEGLFRRALQITPNYKPAQQDLLLLQEQKAQIARRIITLPRTLE